LWLVARGWAGRSRPEPALRRGSDLRFAVEGARLAQRVGRRGLVAEALRDLAYVENTSARVVPTRRLLSSAAAAAGDDACGRDQPRGVETREAG
jgi:hypothetical protein